MHGIVSLLDDEHYAQVESIWAELEKDFGVRGVYVTPFPHFSYQVAESYDAEAVEAVLRTVAHELKPFRVRTAGLGLFNVQHPVLYIPLVRSRELSALHERLWEELSRFGAGVAEYYRPDMWVPHITLAHGVIDRGKLSELVYALSERQFHWEISVNNLSIIYDTGTEQGLRCRFNLGCGSAGVA